MQKNLTENVTITSNGHSKVNAMLLAGNSVGSIRATYDVEDKVISIMLNLDQIDGQPEIFDAAIALLRTEQRQLKEALREKSE